MLSVVYLWSNQQPLWRCLIDVEGRPLADRSVSETECKKAGMSLQIGAKTTRKLLKTGGEGGIRTPGRVFDPTTV